MLRVVGGGMLTLMWDRESIWRYVCRSLGPSRDDDELWNGGGSFVLSEKG